MNKEFTIGEELTFNYYGLHHSGTFLRYDEDNPDNVIIKITKDFIKESIGTEQSVHLSHLKVDK